MGVGSIKCIDGPKDAKMWYALVPFAGLYTAFLYAPHLVHEGANYIFHNGHHQARREHIHPWDYLAYHRDIRLTGSMYRPRGLENIPDED